jgi:transcriptional regulator with XRE-family HTH domain
VTREPRVVADDVRKILDRYLDRAVHLQRGDAVEVLAERAGVSTRTIYRILEGNREWLELDQADRLLIAADAHLTDVEVESLDGGE